ncbi:hypothetical protein SAY86_014981 [Trapa natans]|uniref:Uncharacterized protein n=1 Tax=Trapa natans TaxID=22666 RepID=A0AAN7KHG1_TRANT|nr:hypothetical protein SAY86_014981 [Trapa natans]
MNSMRHRIHAMDTHNLTCKYTLVECSIMFQRLVAAVYEAKLKDAVDGRSTCRMSSEYHAKPDVVPDGGGHQALQVQGSGTLQDNRREPGCIRLKSATKAVASCD